MITVGIQNKVAQQVAEKVCGFQGRPFTTKALAWVGDYSEVSLYDTVEDEVWSMLPAELEEMAERHEYDPRAMQEISQWVLETASKATEIAEMIMD